MLLLTAGLFARATLRLRNIDPGFATANRLFAPVFVPQPQLSAQSAKALYDEALTRLRLLTGVRSASLTTRIPLYAAGGMAVTSRAIPANPRPSAPCTIGAGFTQHHAHPWLLTAAISTLRDQPDAPPVAIINQTLAHRLWPNETATGHTFLYGCDHPRSLKIVGIARDSRVRSLNEAPLASRVPRRSRKPTMAADVFILMSKPPATPVSPRRTRPQNSGTPSIRDFLQLRRKAPHRICLPMRPSGRFGSRALGPRHPRHA